MKKMTIAAAALLVLAGCSTNVLTVEFEGGSTRVEAVSPKIIRVQSIPAGADFPQEASLCVLPQGKAPKCSVESAEGYVALKTGELEARISMKDGSVSFYNADGELVTGEHSRSFEPIEVEGTSGWTVRQTFDSPADEGFFGLGQHQADEWNYKGRNEELYQYNTKISVPFVVSTRRYGILWDSYCFCRWGDPRPYAQLGEVFTLRDRDGVEGALTGTYVPREGEPLVRRETSLAQEFLRVPQCDVVQNAPEGFNFEGSHVTFEGSLEPRQSGIHRFYLYYAGYTRVFVNENEVIPEIWRTAWNPNGRKFEVAMEEGVPQSLRIEWDPDGGVSYNALRVLSPVAEEEQQMMSWWGEMQSAINYYFIKGDDLDGVISGYRSLTGKAPIPPKWAMGYWQSRERYSSQEEILSAITEFRRRGIPLDNIVQDWQYWEPDGWGSHEFDPSRFPDPKAMIDSIHALQGRYMISVWPKFYVSTEHFREMDSKGWIYREAVDSKVIDWLGHEQSFYDAYSPEARKLFWQQMKEHLYVLGVDSWWMDASEPNIHDCTDMDYRKKMCGPTALGPSTKYFNAYALMNAQAIYEGQRAEDPDKRVFLLTRNGFAGLQRYSTASWSGDIGTRWEDMKAQISAGLNYSISGIPMWGQDIGGFSVQNKFYNQEDTAALDEWKEMQVRWHEWGVFCPMYRSHGQWPCREPWNIAPEGDPAYETIVATDRLRYSLMPYIYSLAGAMWFEDYTMMRPLVMDFTDDPAAVAVSDQFLCGPAILVSPVYEYGARSREVYLPAGSKWFDWYDGTCHEGGQSLLCEAPYEHIPLFVRAGSIIPMGEAVQSTAERQDDLQIKVFAGASGKFTLYEDDGLSYGYERGECSRIEFTYDDNSRTLTIGARNGSYPGMAGERNFEIMEGDRFVCNISYDGTEKKVTL